MKHDALNLRAFRQNLQADGSNGHAARFRSHCALVSALDAVGIGLAWSGLLPFSLLFTVHGTLVLALMYAARRQSIHATNQPEVIVATTLFAVLGPAGGLAAIFIDLVVRNHKAPRDALFRWYQNLSPEGDDELSSIVSDEISTGRTLTVSRDFPPYFPSIMEKGQLAYQHWVLAKVASDYHSDYRTVLFDALRSPIPAIRVQAAAIVNGLRTAFRKAINTGLDELEQKTDIADAFEPSISILDQIGSGLLEEADVDRSIAAVRRLFQSTVAGIPTPGNLSRLKNHIVWAAGQVPDKKQRDKLLALAVTISVSINTRARPSMAAYG